MLNTIQIHFYNINQTLLTNDFELYFTDNLQPAWSILCLHFAAIHRCVCSVDIGDNHSRFLRLTNVKTWKGRIQVRFAWRRISICYCRSSLQINPFYRDKRNALQVVVPLHCDVSSFCSICWVVWFLGPLERVHCNRARLQLKEITTNKQTTNLLAKWCEPTISSYRRTYLFVTNKNTQPKVEATFHIVGYFFGTAFQGH